MKNVTIEETGNPVFPWIVSSQCRSAAEMKAKAKRLEEVNPLAFLPTYGAAIALADGELATGGGLATHVDESAPELTEAQRALLELSDEDAPTAHLKAGEANG